MRVQFGTFVFDSATRELLDAGRRVHLSPKAFDLLQVLLERRPAVLSKSELHDRVWAGTFVGDATLSVVVAELRQALGDAAREGRYIRTVHRVGYAFCGMAAEAAPPAASRGSCRCWLTWNGKPTPLADGAHVIGRDPRCDIWVDASGVSRRHARITVGGEVVIEDLGSSNGTFVGGLALSERRVLRDGDVVELGPVEMQFHTWSDDEPPKTERIRKVGGRAKHS
jgi:DNA-binding winged helix-turn-helix (wHTH) protein